MLGFNKCGIMFRGLWSAKKKEEASPVARNLEASEVPRVPVEDTMPARNRQPKNGEEGGKKTRGAGGEKEVEEDRATSTVVLSTKEQRIVALEAELIEEKTKLAKAEANLGKYSDLLDRALAGEEGYKENKADYEKQQGLATRRVEALEGTVKDLKAELAVLRGQVPIGMFCMASCVASLD